MTSKAVVGSSARRIFGLQAKRHGDRGPLPHPAGELVRVAFAELRPRCRPAPGGRRPAHERRCPSATPCSSIGSTIWSTTRRTGLNAFIAPWKTMAMSRQRCGRIESSPPARMSSPSSTTRPATLAVGGRSPINARIAVVLPQPDSPTRPIRCPSVSSRSIPWTACSSPPPSRSNHTWRSSTDSRVALIRRRASRGADAAGIDARTDGRRAGGG